MKNKFNIFVLFLLVFMVQIGLAQNRVSERMKLATVIENPKPNIFFKNKIIPLKLYKTIEEDLGNGNYLLKPRNITLDNDGNFYILDSSLWKIIKLNQDFEFIKSFGSRGNGPGEFAGLGYSAMNIRVGRDDYFYVFDHIGKRINKFTLEGDHVKDYRNSSGYFEVASEKMVIDNLGNIYSFKESEDNRSITVFNQMNQNLFQLKVNKDAFSAIYAKTLRFIVKKQMIVNVTKSDKLIIFFPFSSIISIYDRNRELLNSFKIWPEECLKAYRIANAKALEIIKTKKKKGIFVYCGSPFFKSIFLDEEEEVFYLHFPFGKHLVRRENISSLILKINHRGELISTYSIDATTTPGNFVLKQNKFFINIKETSWIKLFKEGN
jgi:hypothetical protein